MRCAAPRAADGVGSVPRRAQPGRRDEVLRRMRSADELSGPSCVHHLGQRGMTIEELVTRLLDGQACEKCGTLLSPDEPCTGCGKIPPVTGPQLRAELAAAPLTVAEVQAVQAIADGRAMVDAGVEKIHEADRIRLVAQLELARAQAQAALDRHIREHAVLLADSELPPSQEAAAQAGRELKAAQAEHAEIARAYEVACDYRHGVKAQATAKNLLRDADEELAGYRQRDADAKAKLAPKLTAIGESETKMEQLKAKLAEASEELKHPGRIGYGGEAITAAPVRLIWQDKLNDAEMIVGVGAIARWLCDITGVTARIVADASCSPSRRRPPRARRCTCGRPATVSLPRSTRTTRAPLSSSIRQRLAPVRTRCSRP